MSLVHVDSIMTGTLLSYYGDDDDESFFIVLYFANLTKESLLGSTWYDPEEHWVDDHSSDS